MNGQLPSDKLTRRAADSPGGTCVEILQSDLLALVECAEALKWMHPLEGVWKTPNDAQVSFAEAALRKLEAL